MQGGRRRGRRRADEKKERRVIPYDHISRKAGMPKIPGRHDNFGGQEREGDERKVGGEEKMEAPLIDLTSPREEEETSPREEEEEEMLVSFTQ